MRKEGLRNVKSAKQERFRMRPHQFALLVQRECTPIPEVQLVKDVPNNNDSFVKIFLGLLVFLSLFFFWIEKPKKRADFAMVIGGKVEPREGLFSRLL